MAKAYTVRDESELPEVIEVDGQRYRPDWVEVSTMEEYAKGEKVFIPGWLEPVELDGLPATRPE